MRGQGEVMFHETCAQGERRRKKKRKSMMQNKILTFDSDEEKDRWDRIEDFHTFVSFLFFHFLPLDQYVFCILQMTNCFSARIE